MILPTDTDDKILKELMDDWPSVKRKAKSLAEKKCKELVSQMSQGQMTDMLMLMAFMVHEDRKK